tara:strand:+ start:513 stop:3035 length:2523 start_codon:yes stop_codon:yes gene_type:complete
MSSLLKKPSKPKSVAKSASDTVASLMHDKLQKQKQSGFIGKRTIDTTRVPRFTHITEDKLAFGFIELIQNGGDHVRRCHAAAAKAAGKRVAPPMVKENSIEWALGGVVYFGVYLTSRGVLIRQVGRPLSLDAIGSGTQAKAGDEENSGGFGDGAKTAAYDFIRQCLEMTFKFYNHDEHQKRELTWAWTASTLDGFTEKHLVVDITEGDRVTQTPHGWDPKLPIMETCVQFPEDTDVSPHGNLGVLHRAFGTALQRFSWIFYETVADPDGFDISAANHGAWRRSRCFKSSVESFGGRNFAMVPGPLIEVGGIFYYVQGGTNAAPQELVICIPGRGIVGDEFAVFNNQLREVNEQRLCEVYRRQFEAFFARTKRDTKVHDVMMRQLLPLLRGSTSPSFIVGSYTGSLMRYLLHNEKARVGIRDMLLFKQLSPRGGKWGKKPGITEKEERADVAKRVKSAVIASTHSEGKVRYLQFLKGNDSVVVVNPSVANAQLFPIACIVTMESEIIDTLRKVIRKPDGLAERLRPDIRPMIDYIGPAVQVIRITEEPGDGITAYNFRSGNFIVYFQPDFDGDGAVEEICVHLRNDEGETRRAQAFWMQFNHNHACSLVLADRVLWAISKAKEKAPFDIGAKRKTKTEGGDDSSDSEDERVKKKYKLSFDPSKFALKPGEKPKIEKPQRITQSAEKLDTPPAGNLRLTSGSSSDTGRRSEYVQDEPEGSLQMDQEWADEFGCYVPADIVMTRPNDLSERMEIFNKSLDLFRSAVHVSRAQFFASYSTRADWLGLHFPNGICLINMALIKTQSQALETMAHELAHEHSNKHDIRFVQAQGLITEALYDYLLK